ncbi:ABC transporter ATP-binding protein [soil metagenome]
MTATHSSTEALVRLESVSRVFRASAVETYALREVSMTVHQGEYLAIAGPSGCGKSTLLAVLGLLDSPSSGDYHLNGQLVASLKADERARVRGREIGFIFQSFNLIGDLTAQGNVELPLTYRDMPETERKERVWMAMKRVGMLDRLNHYPAQLSGGQQQRVAVARAIAGGAPLLLADEPTGNLDAKNGQVVMDLLGELNAEGATIIIVTHDPRYAKHARRALHMVDGRIVQAEHAEIQL